MGSWTFAYTGAGELLEQTDAKGQTFDFHYDALGRLTTRLAEGDTGVIVDEWDYDQAAAGLLERTRRLIGGQPVFDRELHYDDQLRTRGQTTFLDPNPHMPGGERIRFEQTWQSDPYFGRILSPPYSPPSRREALRGPVDEAFCDRAHRRRTRLYGEDARPSKMPQMRGLAASQ